MATSMSKKKTTKGFSYYFRIEFSSLQGKITTGFCTLGLVSIGLMAVTASLLKPSLDKSAYINEIIYPSHVQLNTLQSQVDALLAEGEKTHLLQGTSLTSEDLDQKIRPIHQSLDSLEQLAPYWQSKEEQLSLQMAANKTEAILDRISKTNKNFQLELLETSYTQDLPLLQQELNQAIYTITNKQATIRQDHTTFIQSRLNNLSWILVLCFIAAFVIGALIGSFIVVKVLAVIRHLKYKLLELSEGKLIAPIPPSKDELNSIGKAINTLTENLRDIREFAREVGQGNFDNNISVFNNQNDLGESLAEMRSSLKRVSDEDKTRTWTANGLATFNEFLRNASNNSEDFAIALTSKIVKYLEVNQGALYLVKQGEYNKAQLELKACYAYDRQKFMEKTIEAGQGLVGQVFLEKEYIYLSDIPERFTTITSGLGEATPSHLLVIPLKVSGEVNGVLELASFSAFPPHKIAFIEKLSESISSAIAAVENSQVTQHLLEEARTMAEAMKLQEENLRQNSEELQATQEQLEREINRLQEELLLTGEMLSAEKDPLLVVSEQGNIEWINKSAEKTFTSSQQQLKNRSLHSLFPSESHQMLNKALQQAEEMHSGEEYYVNLKNSQFRVSWTLFMAANGKFYCSLRLQEQQTAVKNS